jgi:hypothetical protein
VLSSPEKLSVAVPDRPLRWPRYLAAISIPALLVLIAWCLLQFPISQWREASASEERVRILQDYFRGFGAGAPIAYLLFVTVEVVVAPIPGLLLYAPGGLIFGAIPGGLLALAGNTLAQAFPVCCGGAWGATRAERGFHGAAGSTAGAFVASRVLGDSRPQAQSTDIQRSGLVGSRSESDSAVDCHVRNGSGDGTAVFAAVVVV